MDGEGERKLERERENKEGREEKKRGKRLSESSSPSLPSSESSAMKETRHSLLLNQKNPSSYRFLGQA